MRRIAWGMLLLFVFTIPWEYSLDLGTPLGNVARIMGLIAMATAIPAILQAQELAQVGTFALAGSGFVPVVQLYVFLDCRPACNVGQAARLRSGNDDRLAGMGVCRDGVRDLRALLRISLAGCWVLAMLTAANLASPDAIAAGQIRFTAAGQDPNDVARFLDLGFPMAALLLSWEKRWPVRLLALGYFPLGLGAVLLTASRGGFSPSS